MKEDEKLNMQMGVTYMKMEERDRQIREDAMNEGRLEGERSKLLSMVKKKLEKGKTSEEIADELEEESALIEELIQEMEKDL